MSKHGGKFGNSSNSKKGSGLRVFWLPTHKSHKHKKNKYYVQDKNDSPRTAMMSGDSPNSHGKDFFDFKEGRTTPPPTTSKDIGIQSTSSGIGGAEIKPEVVAASVLVEPPKEHGPGTNYVGILDGSADRKREDDAIATDDNKKPSKSDSDHPDSGDNRRDTSKKMNGKTDQLDGKWTPAPEYKKDDETQDDSCAVKCLYYTMQCCECTIM